MHTALRIAFPVFVFCLSLMRIAAAAAEDAAASQWAPLMRETFPQYEEGAYAETYNFRPGDTAIFHILTFRKTIAPRIEKLDPATREWQPVFQYGEMPAPVTSERLRDCSVERGCAWNGVVAFAIPKIFDSGIYQFSFENADQQVRSAFFIVTGSHKNSVLYLVDMQTPCSYNIFANGSFYFKPEKQGQWSGWGYRTLSCARPLVGGRRDEHGIVIAHQSDFKARDLYFDAPFLSDVAAIATPEFFALEAGKEPDLEWLRGYRAIVINGMFEYVSMLQNAAFRDYVRGGGRLILNAREYSYIVIENIDDELRYHALHGVSVGKNFPDSDMKTHDFFGVSLAPSRWISFGKDGPPAAVVKAVRPDHPLLQGISFGGNVLFETLPLQVGGRVITDLGTGKRCLEGKQIDCRNSIVVAEGRWKNSSSDASSVIALVKQGKGHILNLPGRNFVLSDTPGMPALRKKLVRYFISQPDRKLDQDLLR